MGDDPDAARRPPRPVDQPVRQPGHALRQRRGRDGHLQRGRDLVHAGEPAHGADLPARGRQPVPVPHVRGAAGQHERGHAGLGHARGRTRLEGLDRRGGRGIGLGRLRSRQPALPVRDLDPGDHHGAGHGTRLHAQRAGVPAVPARDGRRGHALSLELERAGRRVAARSEGDLPRGAAPAEVERPRGDVGGDLPRSHAKRAREARRGGRAVHERGGGGRGLQHDHDDGRIPAGGRDDLGGRGRRPRPRHARQRRDVDRRHAGRDARGDGELARSIAARTGRRLHHAQPLQVQRLRAVHLQDDGLRGELGAHRCRDRGGQAGGLGPRRARGSRAAGPAVRRDRTRDVREFR